jgi:hypothetical protein
MGKPSQVVQVLEETGGPGGSARIQQKQRLLEANRLNPPLRLSTGYKASGKPANPAGGAPTRKSPAADGTANGAGYGILTAKSYTPADDLPTTITLRLRAGDQALIRRLRHRTRLTAYEHLLLDDLLFDVLRAAERASGQVGRVGR